MPSFLYQDGVELHSDEFKAKNQSRQNVKRVELDCTKFSNFFETTKKGNAGLFPGKVADELNCRRFCLKVLI